MKTSFMQKSVGKSPSGANGGPFLTPFLGHVFLVDELHSSAGRSCLFVFSCIQLFIINMYIVSKITYCIPFWSIYLFILYMYMISKLIYYVTYMYIYPISIQILMLVTNERPLQRFRHDSCGRKRFQSLSSVLINNSGSYHIEQPTNLSLSCHVHLGTKAYSSEDRGLPHHVGISGQRKKLVLINESCRCC